MKEAFKQAYLHKVVVIPTILDNIQRRKIDRLKYICGEVGLFWRANITQEFFFLFDSNESFNNFDFANTQVSSDLFFSDWDSIDDQDNYLPRSVDEMLKYNEREALYNLPLHYFRPRGILKIDKSLSKADVAELIDKFTKFQRSEILSMPKECTFEFIPYSHKFHNHPKMEMIMGLDEDEVIIAVEFTSLFKVIRYINSNKHAVISKQDYIDYIKTNIE